MHRQQHATFRRMLPALPHCTAAAADEVQSSKFSICQSVAAEIDSVISSYFVWMASYHVDTRLIRMSASKQYYLHVSSVWGLRPNRCVLYIPLTECDAGDVSRSNPISLMATDTAAGSY